MIDETTTIKALHQVYVSLSGRPTELNMKRLYAWQNWMSHRWVEADLKDVIQYVKALIRKNRKWPSSLQFQNLIENTSNFEELLSEARAMARVPRVDRGRQEVLKSTGRKEEDKPKFRSAADIMRWEEAFRQFQAFKETL